VKAALALLSGLLLAASFPKFGHPAFAWIAIAPLIVCAVLTSNGPSLARPLRLGILSGVVYFGGALYWVVEVMTTYGGLATPVAALVGVLLVVYLALYPGLFALLVAASARRWGIGGVWLAPFLWVGGEWIRSWFLSGFPWVMLGTSQASVIPIVQAASVVGVYGLSAIVALVGTAAAVVALTKRAAHRRAAAGVLLFIAVITAVGMFRVSRETLTRSGPVMRVGLVQGNIDQAQKWDPKFRDAIAQRYLDLSRQVIGSGAQLVMWPEAATPYFFTIDSAMAAPVRRLAAESRTPFLIGTDEIERKPDGNDAYYNSAIMVGADGRSGVAYRKMWLVPFGEYVPFKRILFFVGPLVEAVSDFSAGTEPVVFDVEGRRISVAICYESIAPWIARAFVQRGSQLLATITNDAWFGQSSAAYQHFEQGAIRAVEEGRYIVRAANTGISGAVDPYGRVLRRTPLFETTAVTVDVRLLDVRTIYSYIGDVVAWFSALVTAIVAVMARPLRPQRP
jgi:apolipoprotein N-acyltransferase